MIRELREAWRLYPPTQMLMAWRLKYKAPPRPKSWKGVGSRPSATGSSSGEVLRGKALVEFMKAAGGTISDPKMLVG